MLNTQLVKEPEEFFCQICGRSDNGCYVTPDEFFCHTEDMKMMEILAQDPSAFDYLPDVSSFFRCLRCVDYRISQEGLIMNSYGFNGEIPEGAIAGMYDILNGEWTGQFFFTEEEIKIAENELIDHYSIEMIQNEEF